ncbi:MAG: hypothetical protein ACE5IR_04850 [bacterium]
MLKEVTRFYVLRVILWGLVLFPMCSSIYGGTPFEAHSRYFSKNITRSNNFSEVNPRFVNNGDQVLFLVFTGNPESPMPWDYVLTKSDRDGHIANYLSSHGVLDYAVLSNDGGILVLRAAPSIYSIDVKNTPYEAIRDWELWYINISNEEEVLVETSMGLPLSEGYRMLGLVDLPNNELGRIVSASPQKSTQLQAELVRNGDFWFFEFYHIQPHSRSKLIFESECWRSYSDVQWWPEITWIDDHRFITIGFNSFSDEDFPQSEGLFSIVTVNLLSGESEIIYSDYDLRPFPKFVLNSSATVLYFQKSTQDVTELWKLNLENRDAEMMYRVIGELGEVRLSSDESSLVFTQLFENNFDIIRLDMERGRIER